MFDVINGSSVDMKDSSWFSWNSNSIITWLVTVALALAFVMYNSVYNLQYTIQL